MPHQQALATELPDGLSPPEECPENRLNDAVSGASLSFVACGAAVADFGELLRELRLALQVAEPRNASPEKRKAAALLAARLESVRWALDGATAATRGLLEDAFPSSADGARSRRSGRGGRLQ